MKRLKGIAAVCAALVITLSLPAAAGEADQSTGTELQEETAVTGTGMVPSAGIRPSYKASDYVKITDDSYKNLTIRLYSPADGSSEAQAAWRKELDTDLMTQLYSLYPVKSFPEDLEAYVVQGLTSTYQQYAEMYGMDFGTFLSTYLGMDEQAFSKACRKAAEKTLKQELLLGAVAEKENITVSDEEYQKGLSDYAARYGYTSSEELLADFDEQTVRISLLMDKTLAFLENTNHIEQVVETEAETETEGAAEPEVLAAQPESAAEQPESAAEQPESAAEQPESAAEQPESQTQQSESAEPESET